MSELLWLASLWLLTQAIARAWIWWRANAPEPFAMRVVKEGHTMFHVGNCSCPAEAIDFLCESTLELVRK